LHTEITDNNAKSPAGWIYFDAECRFCSANRRRWGRIFERRGFVWLPMQAPGTAERLGVAPDRLMAEMWFLPASGSPVSGVSAWIGLMRYVWWLKPLAVAFGLPGINRLIQAAYGWIARNRYCFAGRCTLPPTKEAPRRRSAFFDPP
jgi:predicted DCC family thiol-disulfide oxidoreductase YuxK